MKTPVKPGFFHVRSKAAVGSGKTGAAAVRKHPPHLRGKWAIRGEAEGAGFASGVRSVRRGAILGPGSERVVFGAVLLTLGRQTDMRRIMYIENKSKGLDGPGRIGWVETTRTNRTFIYRGKRLQKTGRGFKHNCFDVETLEEYWVSGPKKNGQDKLYGGVVDIDEDARMEYWTRIRKEPGRVHLTKYRS